MRTGRTLGRTLYRVTGPDWKAHECIGLADTPDIAAAICEAVNAYGKPLPERERGG